MTWMTRSARRALMLAVLAGGVVLGGCLDTPVDAEGGRAARPDGPSALLNPVCAGAGGTTHPAANYTAPTVWARTGNPHRVTGAITVTGAGRLTLKPGVLVCFSPGTSVTANFGGRLVAAGLDSARIVLTAHDPAQGWYGLVMDGSPSDPSYLTNARIEYVHLLFTAVTSRNFHPVRIDSTVIRQSGAAADLMAPQSRISRTRVDSTTNLNLVAVKLGTGTRFQATAIRGAAGDGLAVFATGGVQLLGGRIEGSGGVGLYVGGPGAVSSAQPLRVVGNARTAQLPVQDLARIYPTYASQDSLRGNADSTIVVEGGTLRASLTARAELPWLVRNADLVVDSLGVLRTEPGTQVTVGEAWRIRAQHGGRVVARGSAARPAVFTAHDRAVGWLGFYFAATAPATSSFTNVRIEHVRYGNTALYAEDGAHVVVVDSTVIRQAGQAARLVNPGSRIYRTRVDTTLSEAAPAVELGSNARMHSVLIRGSSGRGLQINSAAVLVTACEVRGSVDEGIYLYEAATVQNCNLVDNGAEGMEKVGVSAAMAEHNWWGDPGGPNGPAGDGVAGVVDFTPWRTAPYVLPYVP